MIKTMKKFGCLLIACLLVASSLCGAAATAEGLLKAMIDSALRTGRTIEGTLRFDAADLLSSFGADAGGSDAATVAAIG